MKRGRAAAKAAFPRSVGASTVASEMACFRATDGLLGGSPRIDFTSPGWQNSLVIGEKCRGVSSDFSVPFCEAGNLTQIDLCARPGSKFISGMVRIANRDDTVDNNSISSPYPRGELPAGTLAVQKTCHPREREDEGATTLSGSRSSRRSRRLPCSRRSLVLPWQRPSFRALRHNAAAHTLGRGRSRSAHEAPAATSPRYPDTRDIGGRSDACGRLGPTRGRGSFRNLRRPSQDAKL